MILWIEMMFLQLLERNLTFFVSFCLRSKIFWKKALKFTILELQQSFLDIFGVAQNFWFNDGDFIAQKCLHTVQHFWVLVWVIHAL